MNAKKILSLLLSLVMLCSITAGLEFTASAASISLTVGQTSGTIKSDGGSAPYYWSSSNESVAKVIENSSNNNYAQIYAVGVGTATITLKSSVVVRNLSTGAWANTIEDKYETWTVTVTEPTTTTTASATDSSSSSSGSSSSSSSSSSSDSTFMGSRSVQNGKTINLTAGTPSTSYTPIDTVKYFYDWTTEDEGIAWVSNNDKKTERVEARLPGTVTISCEVEMCYYYYNSSGSKKYKRETVTQTWTINVKTIKTSIKKVTSPKEKQIKVTWKDRSSVYITGYQIQVATNKKFTKNKKTVTVKYASITSKTIKGLKSKKTYYVRIRTYKTVDGKRVYSSWSTVQKITTK